MIQVNTKNPKPDPPIYSNMHPVQRKELKQRKKKGGKKKSIPVLFDHFPLMLQSMISHSLRLVPVFALSHPMHVVRLSNISRILRNLPLSKKFFFFSFVLLFYMIALTVPSETLSERLIRSCARHRFVAASSRRTEEKVASRRGSGRH